MLVREPVDDVLPIADIKAGICGASAGQMHELRLLHRIFIRTQVPAWRILWKSFFPWKRRPLKAICPQRLVLKIDLRDLNAFSGLGRLSCLGRLLYASMGVVIPRDNSSQQETCNTQRGWLHKAHRQCLLFALARQYAKPTTIYQAA